MIRTEPPAPAMTLRLLHGRKNPEQEMAGWGFDGPVLAITHFHWTYTTLRITRPGGKVEALALHQDMIAYEGCYYGDLVLAQGDPSHG